MKEQSARCVISANDLFDLRQKAPGLKILDATYMVPGGGRSPYDAFLERHIAGAQYIDIDVVADQRTPLPHTVPSPDTFAQSVSALGISNGDTVVIYDQSGVYMAASRVWWMFRLFGHDDVRVLEGGLQGWLANGYPVVSGPEDAPQRGNYAASFRRDLLVTREDLIANLDSKDITVIDVRDAARFHGLASEPRPGMQSGHIPGSANLPFVETIDRASGMLVGNKDIVALYDALGFPDQKKLAISCGSGVTACTVALALHKAKGLDCAIYDGSWSEWGDLRNNLPVEKFA